MCFNCGYFHSVDGQHRDTCENCGTQIADANGDQAKLNRVLTMETALTRRRQRITCDEEERMKYGYNITTHFRYAVQKRVKAQVNAENGSALLDLSYGETADVWRINRGSRRGKDKGF